MIYFFIIRIYVFNIFCKRIEIFRCVISKYTIKYTIFKVALNPPDRIFETLPKVSSWPSNHFSAIRKGGHRVCF